MCGAAIQAAASFNSPFFVRPDFSFPQTESFRSLPPLSLWMQIRRRHLPHLSSTGQPLLVTFRLHGSLPQERAFPPESLTSGKAFVCMDRLLDQSQQEPQFLRRPDVAGLVADSLRAGAPTDYLPNLRKSDPHQDRQRTRSEPPSVSGLPSILRSDRNVGVGCIDHRLAAAIVRQYQIGIEVRKHRCDDIGG